MNMNIEKGWRYVVPPPPVFAPGDLPYPVVLEGPSTIGQHDPPINGWWLNTNIYRVMRVGNGVEINDLYQHVSHGCQPSAPIGNKLSPSCAIFRGLGVHEEGFFRFEHIASVGDSEVTPGFILHRSYAHVVSRSAGPTARLGKNLPMNYLFVVGANHVQ